MPSTWFKFDCMGQKDMKKQVDLTLVLFETELSRIAESQKAGIVDFIVDWECRGKKDRQCGFDTQINEKTPDDLTTLSSSTGVISWCRLNAFGSWTKEEVNKAISAGAAVVLLPMVTSAAEVEKFLRYINGRCRSGILLETRQAFQFASDIAKYPLDIVYVGLNDLMINLHTKSIFSALASGIVEEARACFNIPMFGCAGITVLDRGQPLPCRLLMQEISRLGCNMTFLRRSYNRDIIGRDPVYELNRIRFYWKNLSLRLQNEVSKDHQEFLTAVKNIELNC